MPDQIRHGRLIPTGSRNLFTANKEIQLIDCPAKQQHKAQFLTTVFTNL